MTQHPNQIHFTSLHFTSHSPIITHTTQPHFRHFALPRQPWRLSESPKSFHTANTYFFSKKENFSFNPPRTFTHLSLFSLVYILHTSPITRLSVHLPSFPLQNSLSLSTHTSKMSRVNHTNEDPSRQVWTTTLDEPKSYALSGKIMLTAIIILFAVVVFLVILHLYARWYLLRVRRRYVNRRRSRQQRATHLIFYVDPNNPTMLTVPSRGLDRDVLNSLPIFVYSKKAQVNEQPPLECAVCLSEFQENEEGRKLPKCHHSFHTDCIDMWFESHSTCPLCRSPVEPVDGPAITSNDVVISMPGTSEPEPGSSSEFCPTCQQEGGEDGTTSLAARRKGLEMVVEVPRGNTGSEGELRLSSPANSGVRSPGSRLLSLKRILSMNRKGAAVSPSPGVGPSCGSVHSVGTAESDLESGRFELTGVQNRAQPPR